MKRIVFSLGVLWAASPWASPPLALVAGLLVGICFPHTFQKRSQKLSKMLLQASVVGLGFGMDFQSIATAGRAGAFYTAFGIAFALILGVLLGRLLGVDSKNAYLIAVGTAICGGSAIAAVARVTDASDEQIGVSLGIIFVLNSIALLLFPLVGSLMELTQPQFGLWAALAIHDTSSVVGAGAKYGASALTVAITVKLARTLWILPVVIGTSVATRNKTRIDVPWFVLLFALAAVVNSYLPAGAPMYRLCTMLGRLGLTVTLYLIGSNLTKASLQKLGIRSLAHGVILWIVVALLSLFLIQGGLVRV